MGFFEFFYSIIFFPALLTIFYFSTFHLILWFENRKKIYESFSAKYLPKVSIIVPAFNEAKTILKTLKNLLNLNYPKKKVEIIVVDDGSTDSTYANANKFKNHGVRVFKKPRGGKASAINFGISKARSDFIAVIDADSFPTKDALRNAMKYFDSEKVAAVTTRILPKYTITSFEKWQSIEFKIIAFFRKVKEALNLIDATPGPLSIYRKDVLIKIGKFDEKNLIEDREIAWRILANGYKVKMAYDSFVYTPYPSNFRTWWKQRVRWGVGGLQTIAKYKNIIFRKHPVGTFILPLDLLGIIFQIFATFFFLFLLFYNIAYYAELFIKSIYIGAPFIIRFNLEPTLLTFYGIVLLLFSLIMIKISLKGYKDNPKISSIFTFIFIYVFLFPFVSLFSLYKFFKKEFKWFTK